MRSRITNIRNVASPHWRRWLKPANRCVAPFTSFSEYETTAEGKKADRSEARALQRPLADDALVVVARGALEDGGETEPAAPAQGSLF